MSNNNFEKKSINDITEYKSICLFIFVASFHTLWEQFAITTMILNRDFYTSVMIKYDNKTDPSINKKWVYFTQEWAELFDQKELEDQSIVANFSKNKRSIHLQKAKSINEKCDTKKL